MKFKFRKLNFDPKTLDGEAIECFLNVLRLVCTHKSRLFDDFAEKDCPKLVLSLIEEHFPYFWVIHAVQEGAAGEKRTQFAGFAYLYDIIGSAGGASPNTPSENTLHTATVATCFDKPFWGKPSRDAAKIFLEYVFKNFTLTKLKAESFASNPWADGYLKSLGFKKEGTLARESVVRGKEEDLICWARFNKPKKQ